ncbi:DUF2381 family protein [Archangium lansingense]|uniref:DUF2381 family protein n=1 Tax=Archangium lansingense TaxID=2995310 RepID=A0ABT4A2X2_9BACT|nr:DUF2381 family protein [Archangium lansinium]MCY1075324.1 DUF2381 family protein [Archangium lansinium]
MPTTASASLVALLLHGSPVSAPPAATPCEDIQRIELSLSLGEVAHEVCVRPGILTGFTFDAPVVVELQDEVRFAEVMRGRSGISFVPPPDMAPGERLRLTARWGGDGPSRQSVTFSLVAHSGRATHQVEVFRDQRSREALLQENAQERAANQQLREQVQHLQVQLAQSGGLTGLLLSGALGHRGIPTRQLRPGLDEQDPVEGLSFSLLVTYRSLLTVAAEVWVLNSGSEPWIPEGASLVSPTGDALEGVRVGQGEPIPPQQRQRVLLEAPGAPSGEVTLRLWGADGRTLTIPKVTFP